MIRSYLLAIFLLLCVNARATHWARYYIYIETEYLQGPWSRMDVLESSDNKYLSPKLYENLFGSVPEDMVNTMIANLAENKPELYKWDYTVKVNGDTVVITTTEEFDQIETVKNEITSTLTLNSFSAVTFQLPGSTTTLTLDDIKIPLLDLVNKEQDLENSDQETIESKSAEQIVEVEEPKDQKEYSIWFIASLGLNILLAGILIYRIRK